MLWMLCCFAYLDGFLSSYISDIYDVVHYLITEGTMLIGRMKACLNIRTGRDHKIYKGSGLRTTSTRRSVDSTFRISTRMPIRFSNMERKDFLRTHLAFILSLRSSSKIWSGPN